MRSKTALFSSKPASLSLTTQAHRPVFQHETDKQADNPLQQSIWQPGIFTSGTKPSHTTSTGHNFNFANIPVLGPNSIPVQPKLSISQPNDKYEQEADSVADQVMRMPATLGVAPPRQGASDIVQRTCATCTTEYSSAEEEDRPVEQENLCPQCRVQTKPVADQITPFVQRQTDNMQIEDDEEKNTTVQASTMPGRAPVAGPGVASEIGSLQGGGQPLSPALRGLMEPRFGHDFSRVRVHNGSRAAGLASRLNARAFTVGQDVVFGQGQYQPDTSAGKQLMAHELTHVVQQGAAHRTPGTAHIAREQRIQPAVMHTGMAGYVVQRWPGDGMVPPGDCSWVNYLLLRGSVLTAKAVVETLGGRCRAGDSCLFLAAKIAAVTAEIAARVAEAATCFRGGNTGHREQIDNKVTMLNGCYRFFNGMNCPPQLIAAMTVVVARAREVIAAGAAVVAVALIAALIAAIIALAEVIAALVAAAAAAAAEAAAITAAVTAVIALLVLIKDNLAPGDSPEA